MNGDASILMVDALNLFTRHFVAHPALGVNGNHLGGIVGFLGELRSLCTRFRPKQVYIVWESGGSARRRALYPDYKQHRRPEKLNRYYEDDIPQTVSDRTSQIAALVRLLQQLPVCQMYGQDCEADDVIAYICRYMHSGSYHIILSADKDFYQLIRDNAVIYSPTWKKLVDVDEVINKYSIHPNNFALAKSVCGDTSDNIPGVPGIGFKMLSKRFPEFILPEDILVEKLIELSGERNNGKIKIYDSIVESADLILRNWKLVYLDSSSLNQQQIEKIKYTNEKWSPRRDKITFMRESQKIGIRNFDVDNLFYSMNHIGAI